MLCLTDFSIWSGKNVQEDPIKYKTSREWAKRCKKLQENEDKNKVKQRSISLFISRPSLVPILAQYKN